MKKKTEKKIQTKDLTSIYDFSILRDFRKKKSYTISELSKASGVPVSTISKLERNKCVAELSTLVRLSSSFGIEASELLRAAERKYSDRKRAYTRKKKKLKYEEISYPNIRIAIIEARKGEEIFRPEIHRDDYELCWVRKGKVKLIIAKTEEILSNGDCAQFDASLEHSYKSLENSEILIAHLAKERKY